MRDLIRRELRIALPLRTVGDYLRRWGYTAKRPRRHARDQDPAEVRAWRRQTYPAIEARAYAEGAEIHWGDEMGLRSDHQAGRSYGRRGQTPVVPGTGQRFRCNLISAITNRGRLATSLRR